VLVLLAWVYRRAQAALEQYTRQTIADLQVDDDEMLRGVDWKSVTAAANINKEVKRVLMSEKSITVGTARDTARSGRSV